jgi:hypothetical protein
LADAGEFTGGTVNLEVYPVGLAAVLLGGLVIGVVTLVDRSSAARRASSSLARTGWRGWTMLALLAVLPLTQAAGTGNPVHYMAFNCFVAWLALMIAVATGIEGTPLPARGLAFALVAIGAVLAASIATTGVLRHPYRTEPYSATTTIAAGVPALSGVQLDPETAAAHADLYAALHAYVQAPGRAVMAFDEMPGIVLLLNGRSVGEAWYSAIDPARSATGIRAECADGQPFWGDRIPIIIFNRPPTQVEIGALAACGLSLTVDYRQLPRLDRSPALQVYVPAHEDN